MLQQAVVNVTHINVISERNLHIILPFEASFPSSPTCKYAGKAFITT